MPDFVGPATRSRMMAGIRARDTKPELTVRTYLHHRGFRYRLHVRTLPGTPDIVLPRYRAIVFVHGCFWHQHPGCRYAYQPKSNQAFWQKKLQSNAERDARDRGRLQNAGWRVFVVWECQVKVGDLEVLRSAILQTSDGFACR
jgi:DNA mismatch endonuclease (patch repair protein)